MTLDTNALALERMVGACRHQGFKFDHVSGHGYQMQCLDCGVKGRVLPIASEATKSFEKAVTGCRNYERRNGHPAPANKRVG